jgi:hypothetical protein
MLTPVRTEPAVSPATSLITDVSVQLQAPRDPDDVARESPAQSLIAMTRAVLGVPESGTDTSAQAQPTDAVGKAAEGRSLLGRISESLRATFVTGHP